MEIFKVTNKNSNKIIKTAARAIKEGKIMICPTDTVYGLLCDAKNKKAVIRLFKIKNRPIGKPIPIFVKDLKMAKKLAFINKDQEKFLKKFWPGKVTAVLTKRNKLPTTLLGNKKTIGLRIPNYRLISLILKKLNIPMTGTSANISGKPASTKIKEVIKQFEKGKEKPDLVLDAGNLKPSFPSKVIDLTGEQIKVLRR